MKRNTYIQNTELQRARRSFFDALTLAPNFETVPVREARGRVSAVAVFAERSSPGYNAAAMDGIAVRAEQTAAARPEPGQTLREGTDFVYINTGQPLPDWADAVIMIEDVVPKEDDTVRIHAPAAAWQHVRVVGEDIVQTEMILPSRRVVRPVDIGAMIAGGVDAIEVFAKPVVGILPTGSEIVESNPGPGQIIDSNSWMFAGLIEEAGGKALRHAPVPDDYALLRETIETLLPQVDLLLIGAGSSAGTRDYTRALIEELGEVFVHGVAIKPGKPTVLGRIDGKPVVGMPGYPVSAYVSFREFVAPLLETLTGQKRQPSSIRAVLSQDVVSSFKHKEYARVTLGEIGGRLLAMPIGGGAGVSMSLVRADGIGTIPPEAEGMAAGEEIEVVLLREPQEIREKIVVTGSHDVVLDILGDFLPVTSAHVGSLGGILAIADRRCLVAPIHLLDRESGEYNVSWVRKYLPEGKTALIKGVRRRQGLIVAAGNPLGITGYRDLAREGLTYINRQSGAGTRLLIEYRLEEAGIDPAAVRGFDNAVTTHMQVAQAVLNGDADAGLGAYSAARALGLGFVPTDWEEYDFLVWADDLDDPRIRQFLAVWENPTFRARVEERGGYDFARAGEVIRL